MQLDHDICERARLTRDARFDGRFFIGVRTTGIYCRPICPVRPAKAENVRYFPTAAAAAEAGFRPCLRCRPEAAPGTPAWIGTAATVSRALRLITDGALDDGSVAGLAERLGMGARHLSRLFNQHLGASPQAVAHTRRLLFAKKLIDETDLPLAQVALSSGFGSIRRFNTVFQDTYQRTPSALRHAARHRRQSMSPGDFLLKLPYRRPFDWDSLIGYLALRATPDVESAEPGRYRRTVALDGKHGWIDVRPAAGSPHLELRVAFPDPNGLFRIVERVRRMFDVAADPDDIAARLNHDPKMATIVAAHPGLRLPGAWDGFELAVRAILGQQVTVKGASTLAGRLAARFGARLPDADGGPGTAFPTPEAVAAGDSAEIGLPRTRADAIRALAQAVCEKRVTFDPAGGAAELERQLTAVKGIGVWTAQYVAMRALNEPDAFPASDLGLLKAAARHGMATTPKMLADHAEVWRPWRAYAAIHLWRSETAAHERARQASPRRRKQEDMGHVLQPHG